MQTLTQRIFNSINNLILPAHCFGCDRITNGNCICKDCRSKIEYIKGKTCIKCGKPEKRCECYRRVYHFDGIAAPFENIGTARQGIYNIKFFGELNNVGFFATEMANAMYEKFPFTDFDCVTFVPSRIKTYAKRGFNQSELLAKEISVITEIPLKSNLLKRYELSKTQHRTKSVALRYGNAEKSYKSTGIFPGKKVLLVDDIKTTGATLDICAKLLKQAGADEVFCLTATIV